ESRATRDSTARMAGADRLRTTRPSRRRLESGLDRLTGLVIADVLGIPRRAQRDRIVEAAREAEHQLGRFPHGVRAGRRARHVVDEAAAYRVLPEQRARIAPPEQPEAAKRRTAGFSAPVITAVTGRRPCARHIPKRSRLRPIESASPNGLSPLESLTPVLKTPSQSSTSPRQAAARSASRSTGVTNTPPSAANVPAMSVNDTE